MTSPLRLELRDRLTAAMRARDRGATETLRGVLAALENAEAQPASGTRAGATSAHVAGSVPGVGAGEAPRRALSAEEERAVVGREVAELEASASTLRGAGQQQRADELAGRARLLADVLAQRR